jgi:hypothetical protein
MVGSPRALARAGPRVEELPLHSLAYTVAATFDDSRVADEFVRWLGAGHVQEVIRGGASSAEIVRCDAPQGPWRIEVRYSFPDREAFERYQRDVAPALRAQGQSRFPPQRGVSFERRTGIVVSRFVDRTDTGQTTQQSG